MIKTEVVTLTPQLALEWRKANTDNFRAISKKKVSMYASEMKAGNWRLNGEPIQFYEDGVLANGQHRIEAVIEANTPIETLVCYNVKREDGIYDSGMGRTLLQTARNYGITLNNSKIAAVNFVLNEGSQSYHGKLEAIEYYKKNASNYDLAYDFCTKGNVKPLLKKAGCIAAVYCAIIMNIISYDEMQSFCLIANSGLPIEGYANEPAFILRNMLLPNGSVAISGSAYQIYCFEITWEAIDRMKKNLKKKSKYAFNQNHYKEIIPKVKNIEFMMMRGVAV